MYILFVAGHYQDGLVTDGTVYKFVLDSSEIDLEKALVNATEEFLATEVGQETCQVNNIVQFGFGDACEYIPEEILEKHGILEIISKDSMFLELDAQLHTKSIEDYVSKKTN